MYLGTIQGAEEAQEDRQDGMVANVSADRPESVHTYVCKIRVMASLYIPPFFLYTFVLVTMKQLSSTKRERLNESRFCTLNQGLSESRKPETPYLCGSPACASFILSRAPTYSYLTLIRFYIPLSYNIWNMPAPHVCLSHCCYSASV